MLYLDGAEPSICEAQTDGGSVADGGGATDGGGTTATDGCSSSRTRCEDLEEELVWKRHEVCHSVDPGLAKFEGQDGYWSD